jgi:hypothetical protein
MSYGDWPNLKTKSLNIKRAIQENNNSGGTV